jgi:hypothetical protein
VTSTRHVASSSKGSSPHSYDLVSSRWIIPKAVIADPEFQLIWTAYEGRNKVRFQRGERGSATNIPPDIFPKIVSNEIHSINPYGTLSQAIVFYGLCSAVREQDFDLLKRIINFLVEYHILSEAKRSQLRDKISIRIPAKRKADIARLARIQRTAQEALVQWQAELADEAFWQSPEIAAELARAETAHIEPAAPSAPSQELVVRAGPPAGSETGPPVEPFGKEAPLLKSAFHLRSSPS